MTTRKTFRCSSCRKPHKRKGQRLCLSCHAEANRRYRRKLKAEQKAAARFLARFLDKDWQQFKVAA